MAKRDFWFEEERYDKVDKPAARERGYIERITPKGWYDAVLAALKVAGLAESDVELRTWGGEQTYEHHIELERTWACDCSISIKTGLHYHREGIKVVPQTTPAPEDATILAYEMDTPTIEISWSSTHRTLAQAHLAIRGYEQMLVAADTLAAVASEHNFYYIEVRKDEPK